MEKFYDIELEDSIYQLIKAVSKDCTQSLVDNIDPILLLAGYIDSLYESIVNEDGVPSQILLEKMKNNLSTFNGALQNSIYKDAFADFSKNITNALKERGINL